MVVDDLDIPRITIAPYETDAPSIVDANTVLTGAVGSESLKTIAGRRAQIIEPTGRIDRQELRPRLTLYLHGQAAYGVTREDSRGHLVREALDHAQT